MSQKAMTWAWERDECSSGAKFVLVILALVADEQGRCFPSQDQIAFRTQQSVRTVRRHLSDLERLGLIERTRSGSQHTHSYTLQLGEVEL